MDEYTEDCHNEDLEIHAEVNMKNDLYKFFLIALAGLITICYGTGMFWFGRVTISKPDPQIYVVHDDQTITSGSTTTTIH